MLLELEADVRVVAQVGAGDAVVSAALGYRPDLAVLDVDLPGLDGFEVAELLREEVPDCRVVLLVTSARPEYLRRALSVGAVGLLIKDGPVRELAGAVRRVVTGETVIDPAFTVER